MSDTTFRQLFNDAQEGGDITPFFGEPYQRGSGLWSTVFNRAIKPAAKWLAKRGLSAAADVADDVINNKKNIKEALKDQAKHQAHDIGKQAILKTREMAKRIQTGGRRKTSRKQPKRKLKRKTKKTKLVKINRSRRRSKKRKTPDFLT